MLYLRVSLLSRQHLRQRLLRTVLLHRLLYRQLARHTLRRAPTTRQRLLICMHLQLRHHIAPRLRRTLLLVRTIARRVPTSLAVKLLLALACPQPALSIALVRQIGALQARNTRVLLLLQSTPLRLLHTRLLALSSLLHLLVVNYGRVFSIMYNNTKKDTASRFQGVFGFVY